nr:MAG TPA_asm: hypothetical protein [Caudoviricetes sp.]
MPLAHLLSSTISVVMSGSKQYWRFREKSGKVDKER